MPETPLNTNKVKEAFSRFIDSAGLSFEEYKAMVGCLSYVPRLLEENEELKEKLERAEKAKEQLYHNNVRLTQECAKEYIKNQEIKKELKERLHHVRDL